MKNMKKLISAPSFKALARSALSRLIDGHGYELKLKHVPPRGLRGAMTHLANAGFRQATVVDVGVGRGTPWLYESFPDAQFRLFEPLEEFTPWLDQICERYSARYHLCALGAESGTAEILVNKAFMTSSTMQGYSKALSDARGWHEDQLVRRSIPCRRLDEFAPFRGPVLLKLDVEGHELEVLKGAEAALATTEVIVSEVSVAPRNERGYSFGEFMSAIEAHGFAMIDIAEISALRQGGPVAYIDAVFARADSPLRQ